LRVAIGGLAAALGVLYLSGLIERTAVVFVLAAVLLLGGVALMIGLMTPFASLAVAVCVLGVALSWLPASPYALLGAEPVTLVIVVTGVAIALLGPGAFSIDGYLFGRREIVIPSHSPKS
jgi:uncharacterized membrane protein YphA (DoxX/SURF4 family)